MTRGRPPASRYPGGPDWAWGGADGAGVRVAIVDGGVEGRHPAVGGVAGSVAIERDPSAPGGVRVVEEAPEDASGHGTACAGIVRALASRAELHSVRILDDRLASDGPTLAAALRWAIDSHMRVVNVSVSSRRREHAALLEEVAEAACAADVTLVCAISNAGAPSYPASFPSTLSVAAHAGRDPFAVSAGAPPPADVMARGIDVEVARRGGGTTRASGNSYAAAHVSGLVARILSKHPRLTPTQVKAVLRGATVTARDRLPTAP